MGLCAVLAYIDLHVVMEYIDSRCWTVQRSTSSFSSLSLTIPANLLPVFLHICDQVEVVPVTCLDVSLSISPPAHPLICCCLFLSLPPTHSTCMHVFSLNTCNLRPCQSHQSGTLDFRLLFDANTCMLGLWCQVSETYLGAKAFCSACRSQFRHYYEVKCELNIPSLLFHCLAGTQHINPH